MSRRRSARPSKPAVKAVADEGSPAAGRVPSAAKGVPGNATAMNHYGAALTSARHAGRRIRAIDGLRGLAICMMLVYHFSFDLNWFGVIRADFNNEPFWLGFRDLIVTSFMLLVGVSLSLAARAGISPVRFWRRIGLIAGCAVLVTVGSYATFPNTFITFGMLHCIAVASILARPLARHPRAAFVVGIALVAIGVTVQLPLFDAPWLNWIGLMTHKPATEDYVPLLPWLGVVLTGIALGAWFVARPSSAGVAGVARDHTPAWLAWLGRHSLLVYMLHQPVLIGLLRIAL
jgi:uncharacterized membrane protein